jgi:hypothetical protein
MFGRLHTDGPARVRCSCPALMGAVGTRCGKACGDGSVNTDRQTGPRSLVRRPGTRAIKGLHGFRQFLRRPEGDLLAGFDLDGLAGRRVPADPRRPLAHLEDVEADRADFVTLLEMPGG